MQKGGFTLGVVAISLALTSAAQAGGRCPLRRGEPGQPLVPDAQTAREIFIAVERRFNPSADLKGFPEVEVQDEGSHWAVFRYKPPVETPGGLIVTAGGGQLEMRIGKCDGAITRVHLSR